MMRKDCETRRSAAARRGAGRTPRAVTVCAALWLAASGVVQGGSVRVWPTAVVASDSIRLDDLCVLHGFDPATEERLARLSIGDAPQPGGSRVVHIEMIRGALAAQGINLGEVTLSGSVRSEVSRPAIDAPGDPARSDATGPPSSHRRGSGLVGRNTSEASPARATSDGAGAHADDQPQATLRRAVVDYLNDQLARFRGTVEAAFDRTDEQILNLSGPEYSFHIRGNGEAKLGLVSVTAEVRRQDQVVQQVPLVMQVALIRPTVVARRAINQNAEIQSADVEIVALRFLTLIRLGLTDSNRVIGQRAKRLIRAGVSIEPDMLEQVPLVARGQLVSIASIAGGVRVVTSGKATTEGHLGEVITVRPTDDRKIELDAVVVGPGRVQIGGRVPVPFEKVAVREDGS